MVLLPVSNLGYRLFLTYLRAPTELANIIADLEFSAKVHFFLKFLSKNISGARQNLIFKIDACELNNFHIGITILCASSDQK